MTGPSIFNLPLSGAFADRLAIGLLAEADNPLALARTMILLPNRRAVRAVQAAFVRASGGGLLLPHLFPIGDADEEEVPGALDALAAGPEGMLPEVDPFERKMLLMRLVGPWQIRTGRGTAAVETLRLADALGATLDELQLRGVDPAGLRSAADGEMAAHWAQTLGFLDIITMEWPKLLREIDRSDAIESRRRRLVALARRWSADPPTHGVVAAGIAAADPAGAALLRTVSRLPQGRVLLSGLDTEMDEAEWDAIGRSDPHPQAALKALLHDIDAGRAEVRDWPYRSALDGPDARNSLLSRALASAEATAGWAGAAASETGCDGLAAAEAANAAEEAMVVALAMRRQLEEPGKTAALVTPDRGLARRVAAQLVRWGIEVDDSAGTPLSLTPPGTFLSLALEAAAAGFAPGALLGFLKHPLVAEAEERLDWLEAVRRLDRALRGVRPGRGLAGIRRRVETGGKRERDAERASLCAWWPAVEAKLRPLALLTEGPATLAEVAAVLRETCAALAGERMWDGAAGRAAADALASMERYGALSGSVPPADLPALVDALLFDIAVRPPFGRHPRLAIYGLLEARLQRADLMILGGLNEGVWPSGDHFDPWLPPKIRASLGMPATDRVIGLAAHDFASACGAGEVLLTRARRDATAPTVASRFWLRLHALAGGALRRETALIEIARHIDRREAYPPAARPAPAPPASARPRRLNVTEADTLHADPFAFYAKRVLDLRPLDPLDADPSAAERGTMVHAMLEELVGDALLQQPAARREKTDEKLGRLVDQPLLRALWRPRVLRMLDWTAEQMALKREEGWRVLKPEARGEIEIGGATLIGKADIVLGRAGELAIADYKTSRHPTAAQIEAGFALQLGLLAWLAENGALADVPPATATELAYWKLSGGLRAPGNIVSTGRNYRQAWGDITSYVEASRATLETLVREYLAGARPFEAKLRPEYAPPSDYDHLARVAEWQGREPGR